MHVVITGASSGIGHALARRFAQTPEAKLTLVARRRPALESLAADLSCPHHIVCCDLSDLDHATDWLSAAEAALGPIDVLIHNAGVQVIGDTAHIDVDQGERSIRLNLLTPLRLTRAVLPGMIARGRGTLVDIASMAAIAPTPRMTYYNASKAALAAASEALRGELRTTGVHVVTVYPGIIPDTEMGEKGLATYAPSKLLALQPTGTASTLADLIHRAVRRRQPRVIYPRVNAFARHFPNATRWFMDRFTPPLRA